MTKITLTLLASAALAVPTMVPAMAQSSPQNQKPQVQQQSNATQQQPNQQQANQHNEQLWQQAANQPIPPRQLGRSGVRRVQQALDKKGFDAGRADGIYGSETRTALREFQKSKGIQSNGQINRQTLSELGVNQNSMSNQDGNNNPAPQSSSAKMTGSQANSGTAERPEQRQMVAKSAKMGGTGPSFSVGKEIVQGRPNGMVAMLKQDEQQRN